MSGLTSLMCFCMSVMGALWLLVLLKHVSCIVMSHQGPGPTAAAPPFQKLRMEPNEHRLSWEGSRGGDSLRVLCTNKREDQQAEVGKSYCVFHYLSLCHITNYTVYIRENPTVAASITFPETDPNRPAAAANLRCWVHDLQQMTCRWQRGLGAPQDVQYRMFWRDARLGQDQDLECPKYEEDVGGARVGCHLDNVTGLPIHLAVTVNGTSRLAPVSCSDISVDLELSESSPGLDQGSSFPSMLCQHPSVENLTPPMLTAKCNVSEAYVSWVMKSHFNNDFKYDLQINQSSHSEPQEEVVTEQCTLRAATSLRPAPSLLLTSLAPPLPPPQIKVCHLWLPNAGSVSFRVRAKLNSHRVSAWSNTTSLACGPHENHLTLTIGSIIATAVGLAVALFTLLLLCRRSLMRKLFPPIPRMKDPMEDNAEPGEMVTWEAAPEECEVTHVTET